MINILKKLTGNKARQSEKILKKEERLDHSIQYNNKTIHKAEKTTNGANTSAVLDLEDMLAEADVYWTYGKFHDALMIYTWWISADGMGTPYHHALFETQKRIATRAIDCAVQAQDFKACEEILMTLRSSAYPDTFMAEQGIYALRHDPGNFFLIEFCNAYEENAEVIEKITERAAIRAESETEKKAKLWKKNRTDANKIAITEGKSKVSRITWNFSDRGVDLLKTVLHSMNNDDALQYATIAFSEIEMTAEEARIIGNMAGTGLLEDDAGGLCPKLNSQIFESVFSAMRTEVITRPQNLGIQVEMLRVLHDEGDLSRYAQWLFHLHVVLVSFGGGVELRRRLLAAGKLLGPHPLWDILSSGPMPYMEMVQISNQYKWPMPAKIGTDIRPSELLVHELIRP